MSKHLNEIIKRLGYSESPYLKYRNSNFDENLLMSRQSIKVLKDLSPYAAYLVNDEPFILFFDELSNQEEQKEINKRIWNAQIPVVIFCGTATIKIFNGYTIDEKTHFLTEVDNIIFNTINDIDENSPFSFYEISNQNFWMNYSQQFTGKKLNEVLLDNLTFLTDRLIKTYHIPFTTKLVLRLIFIRYLIDRGVDLAYSGFSSDVMTSRDALLGLLNDKYKLYALFFHLKKKFNGNLFEFDDEAWDIITEQALVDIRDFLSANYHLGQVSLFDLYDFNIIPVELISSIYEILLGKETRYKDNAFYTPKHLVDYILDTTIDEHIEKNVSCKILDPSCGSGIFLVNIYRRIVNKKLSGTYYTNNDSLLYDTLSENIYGIDLNSNAIDVAIFSLYLAMLDYKNPKTLKHFHLPDLKKSNMLVCDFFDEDESISMQDVPFDFIIGNPPWGSKNGKHVDYCQKYDYSRYIQNNDTCRSFILRSKAFCQKYTKCCFILHSKMLYMQGNKSKLFREYLLTNAKIIRLTELSSVRKLIFKDADAPAIILSYSFSDDNTINNRFEYISMKRNEYFRLFNIIVVEKNDVKNVQQRLLKENDWAWKTLVYGLTGDIDTILKLKSTYPSLKESIESQSPSIIMGTGVQYNDGDMNDASHLLGRQLLNSNIAINHFLLYEHSTSTFTKEKIHRPRNPDLFKTPYCLVMRGLDMNDYTMKAVYSERDFVFHEAIYAIKGSFSQKNFLLNVVGLLNSRVYAYFNLMLGSSLGIEREQRQAEEVLSFPFIFNENIASLVERIQEIQKQNTDCIINNDVFNEIDELNKIINKTFNLHNNEYVDYALRIMIPQLTGKYDNDVNRVANNQDFEIYGQYFYDYLSAIFFKSDKYLKINVYPIVMKNYSTFEVIILDEKPMEWFTTIKSNNQKSILANLAAHKVNELFYNLKDVLFFENNSFYIVKPNFYRNWHPAIAQIDLMEITNQIISRVSGGKT